MRIECSCGYGPSVDTLNVSLVLPLALFIHGQHEHSGHGLMMDELTGKHTVEISCLHCSETQPEWHRKKIYHVDKELIALAALHFHSHHEGHKMAITVDGQKLTTGAPEGEE